MADSAGVGSPQPGDSVTDGYVQVQQAPSTSPGNKFSLENSSDETVRRPGTAHTMATQLGGGGTPVSAAQAESKQPQGGELEKKETMLMSSKVKIGSASRSSTDLSYFNREVKHRAQPPARGGRASAARRDRRWASRSSELRRWRQPSGSATGTGAVLAALVDGRACTDDGGAAALRPSSSFSQASQASARKKPCPF